MKKIYLIGIGGMGMGAFAYLLKSAGYDVSGSDSALYPPMSDILTAIDIPTKTPYATANVPRDADLIITGNVATRDHIEAAFVRQNKLTESSFPQALKELFLADRKPVVVVGTHGKTTCASLLAHTLESASKNPGYLIGGIATSLGKSAAIGSKGGYFVIEGDEYDTAYFDKAPKFLHYCPQYLLATSLEFDHADIYGDYTTEAEFGKALQESTILRENIQLISKCGIQLVGKSRSNTINHYSYSKEYII